MYHVLSVVRKKFPMLLNRRICWVIPAELTSLDEESEDLDDVKVSFTRLAPLLDLLSL